MKGHKLPIINYNSAFRVCDGALRLVLLLYFYELGYSPVQLALLFLVCEIVCVVTPWLGGRQGARLGFARTLDTATGAHLQGAGYFAGGVLFAVAGMVGAPGVLLSGLATAWIICLLSLAREQGSYQCKPPPRITSTRGTPVYMLAAVRCLLFIARDICFAVALPVHLATAYDWPAVVIGGFFALWMIIYGSVQAIAPRIAQTSAYAGARWSALLALIPLLIALSPGAVPFPGYEKLWGLPLPELSLIGGLLVFGLLFAVCTSLSDALLKTYASSSGNASGKAVYDQATIASRIVGTLLSGWTYQAQGLPTCLLVSGLFLALSSALLLALPGSPGSAVRQN